MRYWKPLAMLCVVTTLGRSASLLDLSENLRQKSTKDGT
jgi:hypothetical protein